MELCLTNPAHVKICLLSEGVRLNPNFFKYFTQEYQGANYHYSKDNECKTHYPHYMILKQRTICAINQDPKSLWELNANAEEFFLTYRGNKITEVDFHKKHDYLDSMLTEKVKADDIGFITNPSSLNIFIGKNCFFFNVGMGCKFCGFSGTRKELKDRDHVNADNVKKLVELIVNKDTEINQVYFVGSTDRDFDRGFSRAIQLLAAAKEVAPDYLDLILTSFPPKDFGLIGELKNAGCTRFSLAVETATTQSFREFCPGKEKYYGRENFEQALEVSTQHFPRATYASIVQGLDNQQDLIDFMWQCYDKEIMPTMNVYYDSPHSELYLKKKRPSKEYLYKVSREHQKIFAKSNMRLFSYGADRHCMDWEAYRQMI